MYCILKTPQGCYLWVYLRCHTTPVEHHLKCHDTYKTLLTVYYTLQNAQGVLIGFFGVSGHPRNTFCAEAGKTFEFPAILC